MTQTQEPEFTVYLTTSHGYGAKTLDVIPGPDGSGDAPVLTVPLPTIGDDADGDPIVDHEAVDEILREHGFRIVQTRTPGALDQPGHWALTDFHWALTDFGACASAVRVE